MPRRSNILQEKTAKAGELRQRRARLGAVPKTFDLSSMALPAPYPVFLAKIPLFSFERQRKQKYYSPDSPAAFDLGYGSLEYTGVALIYRHLEVLLALSYVAHSMAKQNQYSATAAKPSLVARGGELVLGETINSALSQLKELNAKDPDDIGSIKDMLARIGALVGAGMPEARIDVDDLLHLLEREISTKERLKLRQEIRELSESRLWFTEYSAIKDSIRPYREDLFDVRNKKKPRSGNHVYAEGLNFFTFSVEHELNSHDESLAQIGSGKLCFLFSPWFSELLTTPGSHAFVDARLFFRLSGRDGLAKALMLYLSAMDPRDDKWEVSRWDLFFDLTPSSHHDDPKKRKHFPASIRHAFLRLMKINWLRTARWVEDENGLKTSLVAVPKHLETGH